MSIGLVQADKAAGSEGYNGYSPSEGQRSFGINKRKEVEKENKVAEAAFRYRMAASNSLDLNAGEDQLSNNDHHAPASTTCKMFDLNGFS